MNLVEKAFNMLYPDKNFDYGVSLKYSGRFKAYNANASLCGKKLAFNLSKKWKEVSDEDIKIGLIQSLLLRLFKGNKKTINIDLYNIFIKKLHLSIPKTKTDPVLEESFNRVNDQYFYGIIERPNLKWGSKSLATLGSYEYQTDTIKMSSIFRGAPLVLLDYVMYHEMLHKKHKFDVKGRRSYHHTSRFKKEEKKFEGQERVEKELKKFCRKYKRKMKFSFFRNIYI